MEKNETFKGYMPKKSTLVFIILMLMLMVNGVIYGKDFRNTSWGMTKAQVKKVETGELYSDEEDKIAFVSNLYEYKVLIIYYFADDKLARARYAFLPDYINKNGYIIEYNVIHDLLIKKYGKPKEDYAFWANDLYKDDPSKWGLAISIGHLYYYSSWENDRTMISFIIYGENYKIDLLLEYSSKELAPLEKKERDKNTLDDF